MLRKMRQIGRRGRPGASAWRGNNFKRHRSAHGNIVPVQSLQYQKEAVASKIPYQLTDADIGRLSRAAHRLATDPELINRLIIKRPRVDR